MFEYKCTFKLPRPYVALSVVIEAFWIELDENEKAIRICYSKFSVPSYRSGKCH